MNSVPVTQYSARPWGKLRLSKKMITGKMNDICLVTLAMVRSWSVMSGRGGGIIIRDCAKVKIAASRGRISTAGWSSSCAQSVLAAPALPDSAARLRARLRDVVDPEETVPD